MRHCAVTVNGSLTASLVAVEPGLVPTAGFMLFPTCPSMLCRDYHLELGQLWWCSVWKGTAQDCMDHLGVQHHTYSSVGLKMLGKYVPPWTVTHEAWRAVLRPGVSGIATDGMLFHQHGGQLVDRYRLYKDPLPHVFMQGTAMRKLTRFANQAKAVARLTSLNLSIPLPGADNIQVRPDHSAPVSISPVWKDKRTTAAVC